MWLKNKDMYGWYRNGTFITFWDGAQINGVVIDDGLRGLFRINWHFCVGTVPRVYQDWIKENIV